MSELIVTVTGEDALGRLVSGSATAEVLDCPPPCPPRPPICDVIEIGVDASRVRDFARLIERHAGAFAEDLERFMRREHCEEGGRPGGGDRT